MNKNDIVQITIEDMTSEGSGVGKADGFPLFVPLTAVGDVVSVRVVKLLKSYGFGIVDKIIAPSPVRIQNSCPGYKQCGGCVYRHISYEEELRIKTKKVKDAFYKIANMDIEVPLCIGSRQEGYRNKTQMPVGQDAKGTFYGFFSVNSHRIVPFDACAIQNPAFNEIARLVKAWMDENKVSAYDSGTGKGLIRHIYLRIGEKTGEIMVCLVANGDRLPAEDRLIETLKKSSHQIKGILLNINRKNTNVILGHETKTLWGRNFIYDKLGQLTFKISPLSFYQINRDQTENLYNEVLDYSGLTGTETVLDLYCGTGTITLYLSAAAKAVYGVEIVPDAIENARENAKLNDITNAQFFTGDSAEGAEWLKSMDVQPNIVVVDPPRKGCDRKVIEDIVAISPKKLIYVSCDPATLARDCKSFAENGYNIKKIQPFDMFPRTSHTETVVLMTQEKIIALNN